MLRASAFCEGVGIPTSTLVGTNFLGLAAAASKGQGMPNLPIAVIPKHPGVQSKEELRASVLERTLDDVVQNLLSSVEQTSDSAEPDVKEVFFRGSFDEVNELFLEKRLSDGLPIVPPTRQRIEEFLSHTDRSQEEVLGTLLPDKRIATVWSVAANGVMAGCAPRYMPVLVALVEAMADPKYGVEHSGNTPGGETLIIINGPLIKELGFNYTQGVMRDGFRPNTSIGRFWRLYLRNVAGFLPHENDKCTFGNTWRVVIAENEDVVNAIGWEPNSVDMGFKAGDNTVTISRLTGGNHISAVSGSTPEEMMPYLADAVVRQTSWQIFTTVGERGGTYRPLILLSPILAETIAGKGWSKKDLQQALYEQARMSARQVEQILRDWIQRPTWNIADEVKRGRLPKAFHESDDPDRKVPLVWNPGDFMIVVTGDIGRNSAYVFAHNGYLGFPTARKIALPSSWAH